jgi:hypothetical protein
MQLSLLSRHKRGRRSVSSVDSVSAYSQDLSTCSGTNVFVSFLYIYGKAASDNDKIVE